MYISQDIASKHQFSNIDLWEGILSAADGKGIWVASADYATRSPEIYSDNFW